MNVSKIMRVAIATDKNILIGEAAKLMIKKRISSLIFIRENKLEGIITREDIVRNFGKEKTISSVMGKNIISISPEESLEKASKIMKKNRISHLPVVKDGELEGIISSRDIALALCKSEGGEFVFE